MSILFRITLVHPDNDSADYSTPDKIPHPPEFFTLPSDFAHVFEDATKVADEKGLIVQRILYERPDPKEIVFSSTGIIGEEAYERSKQDSADPK